jgi:ABC-2 type transport system ATP-binding protein
VLFQHPALDGKLRVVENLRCGGHLFGMSGSRLEESIKEWTQATGVADRLGDFVETLSGGLRRRVEIAKALLPSPGILLLDEPSSGLDPGARAACREIFRQLQSRGLTVVMTTHLMEEAEEADLVAVLHDGQIVAQGPPAALCGELGEFVLLVRARDPGGLVAWVESREDRPAIRRTGDEIRLYSPQVADWQSLLLEHRGGQILSTTLARPGLEDVFAHHTGITIAEAEARFSPV